jgi:hypothetical protein
VATFPIHREELAKLLGVTVQWCEDLHYGMPCSRRLGDGTWWLSGEAELEVWKKYADVWLNPPSTEASSPFIVDNKGSRVEEVSRPLPPFGQCEASLLAPGPERDLDAHHQ